LCSVSFFATSTVSHQGLDRLVQVHAVSLGALLEVFDQEVVRIAVVSMRFETTAG